MVFRLKVTASESALLGPHVLRGKLVYRDVSNQGIFAPQNMGFEIPIRVVAQDEKVKKNEVPAWAFDDQSQTRRNAKAVGMVVLIPLAIPVVILEGIGCLLSGHASCGS